MAFPSAVELFVDLFSTRATRVAHAPNLRVLSAPAVQVKINFQTRIVPADDTSTVGERRLRQLPFCVKFSGKLLLASNLTICRHRNQSTRRDENLFRGQQPA